MVAFLRWCFCGDVFVVVFLWRFLIIPTNFRMCFFWLGVEKL